MSLTQLAVLWGRMHHRFFEGINYLLLVCFSMFVCVFVMLTILYEIIVAMELLPAYDDASKKSSEHDVIFFVYIYGLVPMMALYSVVAVFLYKKVVDRIQKMIDQTQHTSQSDAEPRADQQTQAPRNQPSQEQSTCLRSGRISPREDRRKDKPAPSPAPDN